MEPEINEAEGHLAPLNKVTPLSRYLALALFVILPFLGGWIGYTYAPEKVVEVERVVIKEVAVDDDISQSEVVKATAPEISFSSVVTKRSVEYKLQDPPPATDGGGPMLVAHDTNTGADLEIENYWFRFSDQIATIGDKSILLYGTQDGLQILNLTAAGIETETVALPPGLTAREQILCEMGCKTGVNWEVDTSDNQVVLVVDLHDNKTFEELVDQYRSFGGMSSGKTEIDEKMRELNFVEEYRINLK
jgi:hypothetical protein